MTTTDKKRCLNEKTGQYCRYKLTIFFDMRVPRFYAGPGTPWFRKMGEAWQVKQDGQWQAYQGEMRDHKLHIHPRYQRSLSAEYNYLMRYASKCWSGEKKFNYGEIKTTVIFDEEKDRPCWKRNWNTDEQTVAVPAPSSARPAIARPTPKAFRIFGAKPASDCGVKGRLFQSSGREADALSLYRQHITDMLADGNPLRVRNYLLSHFRSLEQGLALMGEEARKDDDCEELLVYAYLAESWQQVFTLNTGPLCTTP